MSRFSFLNADRRLRISYFSFSAFRDFCGFLTGYLQADSQTHPPAAPSPAHSRPVKQESTKVSVGSTVFAIQRDVQHADGLEFKLEQSLVYLGQNGASFSVGYREFGDGSARRAFDEDVNYQNPTIGTPTEIAFRSVRLKV